MAGPYKPSALVNYLGFGKQVSKGTGVAPTVFLPYMGSVQKAHGQSGSAIREAGSGLYVTRSLKEAHDPNGSGSAAWRPTPAATLAAWFLGADADSGAGPYTHVLTPSEANVWLSVEQNLEDELTDRFVDCMLRRMVIVGEDAKDLMVTFEWTGLTAERQASAATASYSTGVDAKPHKQDQATYTVDGSAATNVRRWELELVWTLDEDIRLSKVTRNTLLKMRLDANLTVRQLLNAETDHRKVNYGSASGTEPSSEFYQTASDAFTAAYDNGLATTSNRQITVAVPQVDWMNDAEHTELNPDGTEAVYLTRRATATKKAGAELATLTAITNDSAAYV